MVKAYEIDTKDLYKEEPIQTLANCSTALTANNKRVLTEHFVNLGTSGNIQSMQWVTQNLELIVSITEKNQVVDKLVRYSSDRNMSERQQIIVSLKQHQGFVGIEQRNEIIRGLIQTIIGQDRNEGLKAINALEMHTWMIPERARLKNKSLREILKLIESKESSLTPELIHMLYNIRPIWEKSKPIKRKFWKILQTLRKDPDPNIANASNKTLGEMKA